MEIHCFSPRRSRVKCFHPVKKLLSLMITFKALSVKVNLERSVQLSQMSLINPHPAMDHPTEHIMLSDSRCSGHLLAHVQTNQRTSLSSSRHEPVSSSAPASDWKACEGRVVQGIVEKMFFGGNLQHRLALGVVNHYLLLRIQMMMHKYKVFSVPNLLTRSNETILHCNNHFCVPSH